MQHTGQDFSEVELYAIAPTQFDKSGGVDASAIRDNVARLEADGIGKVLLTGAYGEFQSLTDVERESIVSTVASGTSARIMACAALPSTMATVKLAERLMEAGAHEVMVSPPLLAELEPTDILRHFEVLASRVAAPLVVYNNPTFGTDLDATALSGIAALGKFVAIKQGSIKDDGVAVAVETMASRGLRVLGASDLRAVESLSQGANGITSTNCWVFPSAFKTIVTGDVRAEGAPALAMSRALRPYFDVVRSLGQPRCVKAAMMLRGFAGSGVVRLPYVELERGEMDTLKRALREADDNVSAVLTGGSTLKRDEARVPEVP